MHKVNAHIDRNKKSKAATAGMQLRNRFAEGMPAIFDNQDGTYTDWSEQGHSVIRFTDGMIVNVKEAVAGASNAAAA